MTSPQIPLHHIIPKDRVGTLIDSIYAFSMTLLVITVDIPSKYNHVKEVAPVHEIVTSIIPDLLHYFIAFVLLATFWYFEHQRFRYLTHLDRPLLCLNIASLAFVCLIPFSTNVAGDYPLDIFGAIIFELNILVIGMIAFFQWIYIRRHGADLVPELGAAWIHREILWALVFPLLAVAGIAIAAFQVPWSVVVFLLAPLLMVVLYWKDPVKKAA
ncbi:MAG: TMEM175 family protein [Methanoregula sp.]|jgi:uncharacterized membrane protein